MASTLRGLALFALLPILALAGCDSAGDDTLEETLQGLWQIEDSDDDDTGYLRVADTRLTASFHDDFDDCWETDGFALTRLGNGRYEATVDGDAATIRFEENADGTIAFRIDWVDDPDDPYTATLRRSTERAFTPACG